jgi:hypothetical protein
VQTFTGVGQDEVVVRRDDAGDAAPIVGTELVAGAAALGAASTSKPASFIWVLERMSL